MEKQNVTLSLPKAILRKAKLYAAKKETSLSELMKEALQEKIMQESNYQKAMNRQLKLLKQGFNLGTRGKISVSREETHVRR